MKDNMPYTLYIENIKNESIRKKYNRRVRKFELKKI